MLALGSRELCELPYLLYTINDAISESLSSLDLGAFGP